jgi:hypothetical protein
VTEGKCAKRRTARTEEEQGAGGQGERGSQKKIKTSRSHNRTEGGADRLSNYQVSISNKADFSTHTYQQDFHVVPNPKKTIILGMFI